MNMLGIPALVLLRSGEQRLNNSVVIQRLSQIQDTQYPNDRTIPDIQVARKSAMIYEILLDFCGFSLL
jgi:hypothetical protein